MVCIGTLSMRSLMHRGSCRLSEQFQWPARSPSHHASRFTPHGPSAGQIIRQRRSAVSFDGKTSISAATFFRMMQLVMPRSDRPQLDRPMPWDVWPYDPAIHLMLFVHRVDGLKPGLYFLVRDP